MTIHELHHGAESSMIIQYFTIIMNLFTDKISQDINVKNNYTAEY